MNKLIIIYNELPEENKLDFLMSCVAKQRGLFGVPRIAVKNGQELTIKEVEEFLSKPIEFYKTTDLHFHKIIINDNDINNLVNSLGYNIIFDPCRICFDKKDEFFESSPEDIKKCFNLNIRNLEKKKFLNSNFEHFRKNEFISSKVLLNKLNDLWTSKWGTEESYKDIYYHHLLDNLN